jgi:hypothetical protein
VRDKAGGRKKCTQQLVSRVRAARSRTPVEFFDFEIIAARTDLASLRGVKTSEEETAEGF